MNRINRIVFAAAVAAAGAPNADATCRGTIGWGAWMEKNNTIRAEHGAAINIDTTVLSSKPDTFVTHEMVYYIDGNCFHNVEVGVVDGWDGTRRSHQAVFWADDRPNGGGFHEHYPAVSWRRGAYYQVKVVWAGNYSWNVYFGGVWLGRSTGQYYRGTGRCLRAGVWGPATYDGISEAAGHMYGWARKARNNVWYQDWDGKDFRAVCPADIEVSNDVTTEAL
jgi:hypothetical protein